MIQGVQEGTITLRLLASRASNCHCLARRPTFSLAGGVPIPRGAGEFGGRRRTTCDSRGVKPGRFAALKFNPAGAGDNSIRAAWLPGGHEPVDVGR